jgi:hypothetical protein
VESQRRVVDETIESEPIKVLAATTEADNIRY